MPGQLQPSFEQPQNRMRYESGWSSAQNQGRVGNDYTVGQMANPQPSGLKTAQNQGLNGNDYTAQDMDQPKSSGMS